jgi:hypothetical protein
LERLAPAIAVRNRGFAHLFSHFSYETAVSYEWSAGQADLAVTMSSASGAMDAMIVADLFSRRGAIDANLSQSADPLR